jgi:lipopolysaccharide transport system ATP-binding protein
VTSHPAIRVSGLSKLYRVGARQQGYKTLRESIADACAAPFARLRGRGTGDGGQGAAKPKAESGKSSSAPAPSPSPSPRLSGEQFWALKDVSFEVQPGEVVGIIGRNGAGKSTLLKILSRITEPTSGRIELRGRVGSLLEVGTGFHPELSGRENIYMNGSILGMSRREIQRKFDEIVDFSGIEDFLDTPVKRYSSGMYVRLAFAVAAHLEPEILIVDEVLAVGDAEFQRKCLGKMKSVASHGRTVLFVSHNMPSIEALCQQVVYVHDGRVVRQGPTTEVVAAYRTAAFSKVRGLADSAFDRCKYFRNATLLDGNDLLTSYIPLGSDFRLRLVINAPHPVRNATVGIGVDAVTGERLLTVHTPVAPEELGTLDGLTEVFCTIPSFPLAPGEYTLKLALSEFRQELEAIEGVVPFTVDNAEAFGEGRGFHRGVCVAPSRWNARSV